MPRPQFSVRTLLWLTLVVAAFLGGIAFEKERARREGEEFSERIAREILESQTQRPIRRGSWPPPNSAK